MSARVADLGADRADHGFRGGERGHRELDRNGLAERLIVADAERERIELHGREAEVDVVARPRGGVLGIKPQLAQAPAEVLLAGRRIQVGVGPDPVAHAAPEQAMHGLAEMLADDVPARDVERAQNRELGQSGTWL